MADLSVLTGGRAGDGINSAGLLVSHLLNRMGYSTYMYFDYPSLIKGGHNFTITRAADMPVGACREKVDIVLALNQDTIDLHRDLMHDRTVVIYDSGKATADGQGVPVEEILKDEQAPPVMGNSCMIGAFAGAAGIPFTIVEEVFGTQIPRGLEKNLAVARRGYGSATRVLHIDRGHEGPFSLLSGNEAIGLGLLHGGLDAYVAYPMTPTSNLLHFLAGVAEDHPLTVVHPENEISVILMAHGLAYAGKRTAVGTSGGGFCLMTESFSMAGTNEVPLVVVMGQRTGPSTGLPTYTGQTDLHFMLHAGQGEFPRLVVAPGDITQACAWSARALSLAWTCQVPAIILVDKTLCEGIAPLRDGAFPPLPDENHDVPAGGRYRRYTITASGISPMLHPPVPGSAVKANSYIHDEAGITTERADVTVRMTEKRLRKGESLLHEIMRLDPVERSGREGASITLLCWGSTLPVCREVAGNLDFRVVQPVVLSPFPGEQLKRALSGAEQIVAVEENALGQLAMLCARNGITVDTSVRKIDGRPFAVEELERRILEVA
ncbi:MAG: pyruvate ferredoxin oxidoreductase [Methanomicrobiales archaeon]|nr:pyruvate ferredoxin oxidoreductase [Methanomicrobiales archaeon]